MKHLIAAVIAASLSTAASAAATAATAQATRSAHDTQRLLIRFKDTAAAAGLGRARREQAQVDGVAALAARKDLSLRHLREGPMGAVVVSLPAPVTLDEARRAARLIADDPAVAHAEPDIRVFAQQVADPLLPEQWSLPDPLAPGGSPGGINVTALWPLANGNGITVAVIDTGYTSHPDLDGAWLPGHDFISPDPDGSLLTANDGDGRDGDAADPGDWCLADGVSRPSSWHGTAVAGIIAAHAGNGYGVAGVAPGVRILPVRAIGRCGGYMSDVMDAMRWAAGLAVAGAPLNPYPAKVLNLSLGSAPDIPCSTLQQQAVSEIAAANVLVVAAAGNEGVAGLGAPANCKQVLAVAAHTRQGTLAAYSNYHAGVALTAPGGTGSIAATAILTSGNAGATVPGAAQAGSAFAGTSAATPHVAAAAALLWANDPARSAVEIRNALTSAARPWPAGTQCLDAASGRCGSGMLDVGAAFSRLGSQVAVDIAAPGGALPGNTVITVTANARSNYAASQLTYRWTQTSGTPALLADADTANLRLTLPANRTTVGLRVTVGDPLGRQSIDDTVVEVNNPPAVASVAAIAATPGESIVRYLGASDPDGDAVRYTLLRGPLDMRVGRADGKLEWLAAEVGRYPVRVAIEDVHGQRGADIEFDVRVVDELSTASPLHAPGGGGGGAVGWAESGLVALALAALSRKRRAHSQLDPRGGRAGRSPALGALRTRR
jgi:serine protease